MAEDAFDVGTAFERESALSEGLGALSALYGSLDSTTSPEASAHLGAACDACVRALGAAYAGDRASLTAVAAFFRSLSGALPPHASLPRLAA